MSNRSRDRIAPPRPPVLPLLMVACFTLAGLSSDTRGTVFVVAGVVFALASLNQMGRFTRERRRARYRREGCDLWPTYIHRDDIYGLYPQIKPRSGAPSYVKTDLELLQSGLVVAPRKDDPPGSMRLELPWSTIASATLENSGFTYLSGGISTTRRFFTRIRLDDGREFRVMTDSGDVAEDLQSHL